MIIDLFNLDLISIPLIILVLLVGSTVGNFAFRYIIDNKRYYLFFTLLILLIMFLLILFTADNMLIIFVALAISNMLLIILMIHNANWSSAKFSGMLTAKIHLLGLLLIAVSFFLLYKVTGHASVRLLIQEKNNPPIITFSLILLMIGAMIQSAIWPFHKWLISSLNSPTPVSAIMHAGIVNGGVFLLVRFAPLYLKEPLLLNIIFIIGLITAIIGTFWKLIQSDIKRMLACSTMGQMGFMIIQCGLGLFPAALAHMIFHGIFKSYLFLSSASVVEEKRINLDYPPKILAFICSLLCGYIASYGFVCASNKNFLTINTNIILILISFISGCQFSLPILRQSPLIRLPIAIITSFIIGFIYGANVYLIEYMLKPLNISQPQVLNFCHIIGIFILIVLWFAILFRDYFAKNTSINRWTIEIYVRALNASQPHPATITSNRNKYKYM